MDEDSGQKSVGRRELLLMRHAKSSWGQPGRPDFERELSSRGRRDAGRMGRWLAETGRVPDHVVCSPAHRARQTAQGVLEELGLALEDVRWAEQIYEASPTDLLSVLAENPDTARCVLMIGHNPGFESLAEMLASGAVSTALATQSFPTATVAHLAFEGDWNTVSLGVCELVTLVRPGELASNS